jgi:hypothetical protein
MEGENFAYATDERTMEMRRFGHQKRAESSSSLTDRMKAFVQSFYRGQGESTMVGRRDVGEMEEAPVLKPRRGYRYQFNA